jgi:hypothetical protein
MRNPAYDAAAGARAITFSDRWPAAETYRSTTPETPFLLR